MIMIPACVGVVGGTTCERANVVVPSWRTRTGELETATMVVCGGAMDPLAERDLLQRLRDSLFSAPSLHLSLSLSVEEKLIHHRRQPPTPRRHS
jgi:hypothetical protein